MNEFIDYTSRYLVSFPLARGKLDKQRVNCEINIVGLLSSLFTSFYLSVE